MKNKTAEEILSRHDMRREEQELGYILKVEEMIELMEEYVSQAKGFTKEDMKQAFIADNHFNGDPEFWFNKWFDKTYASQFKPGWTTKKPKADREFLLVTANQYDGGWYYSIYKIEKITFDGKWYWGLVDSYGDEEPYSELKADKYLVLSKNS